MPLDIELRQVIRSYPAGNPDKAKAEATDLLRQLTYAMTRAAQNQTLIEGQHARFDMQKDLPNGGKNLQVQLNKRRTMTQGTTIAQVTIDGDVFDSGADTPAERQLRTDILDHVRRAFRESLKTRAEYRVRRKT